MPAQRFGQHTIAAIASNAAGPAEPISRIVNHVAFPARIPRDIAVLVRVGAGEIIEVTRLQDLLRHEVTRFLNHHVLHHIAEEGSADHPPLCLFFHDTRKVEDALRRVLMKLRVEVDHLALVGWIPQEAACGFHSCLRRRDRPGDVLHRLTIVRKVARACVVPLCRHRSDDVIADDPASERRALYMTEKISQHIAHLGLPDIRCERGAVGIQHAVPIQAAVDGQSLHLVK